MRRWISRTLLALVLLLAIGAVAVVVLLRGSLPALDGEATGTGLSADVTLERDARGSVTISGRTRDDLAYALGYAHAQDRWFQMDLLRRAAAGELSALLGPSTLDADRSLRVHRFRAAARAAVAAAPASERALLEAYARGANAGLASLRSRPWEYWVLRAAPEPWRAEDSLLVVYAMFLDLQGADVRTERQRGLLFETLPAPVAEFLHAEAHEWSAADEFGEFSFATLGAGDLGPLSTTALKSVTFFGCTFDPNSNECVNPFINLNQFALDNIVTDVPEPASLALVACALGVAGFARRRNAG